MLFGTCILTVHGLVFPEFFYALSHAIHRRAHLAPFYYIHTPKSAYKSSFQEACVKFDTVHEFVQN